MSTQIIAAIVIIASSVLTIFHVDFGTERLTEIVQAVAVVASAGWIWYQRVHNLERTEPGQGDVNFAGVRKP